MSSQDLTTVQPAIEGWIAAHLAAREVAATDLVVALSRITGGGYSNEILVATATYGAAPQRREERLVFRLPPRGPALFPAYDLALEVAVQRAVGEHGVPVPRPLVHETDPGWLDTPFLVMPLVPGHNTGELAVVDPWVIDAPIEQQAAMHASFLATLARIHTTPWRDRPIATQLRGATGSLTDELGRWDGLVAWIFDGAPPARITDAFAWCRDHEPVDVPPASVLWGDVRLGNAMFDDERSVVAILDWEMASIGPAEMDLAWLTALDALGTDLVGRQVPGFLTRDEVVARHEQALGRPLVAFRWYEVFALCRSAALSIRADRLESRRRGKPPRGIDGHVVLTRALDAIEGYDPDA